MPKGVRVQVPSTPPLSRGSPTGRGVALRMQRLRVRIPPTAPFENKMIEIYLHGHGYGYSKSRAGHLASKGLTNSLSYQYQVGMIENFKEYEDESLQKVFDLGVRAGKYFGYMTNLAEDGKCLQPKWQEYNKCYIQTVDEYKKFCIKLKIDSGVK